ncbi:uncharacterized protein LOC126907018 [Daktulosphaira vitifoliae]|uniref:uncharacterized protein LOC126907018 n=1 Tax=Daktulosphaira vitifoliae TaxID=58002 RepID=UPI0021AA5659|nr:uncharacterized protein LOC126907018 [Daktulosphaira vitifoliae]XP_050543970.1 uncharacterized protein LOC126907018 [Daktulosphaira vitifoliae]
MTTVSASTANYYTRHHQTQPFKTLNGTNAAILRTDRVLSYRPQCTAKRKSAVELLQETKSLYVKSETVLDRKQELRRSLRSSGSSDKGSTSYEVSPSICCHHIKNNCCSLTCLPPPKSPRLVTTCNRKSTADSQQLQNDLRRLLNADSKENVFEAASVFLDDDILPPPIQYRRTASHDQHHHQSCGSSFEYVAMCHKSMPDLTGTVDSTCHRNHQVFAPSESICDTEDEIIETNTFSSSPQRFGNVNKSSRILPQDETDTTTNVTSFPDSLSLTSYKTDARWQQSAHGGETSSSIEEENVDNLSPTRSSFSPAKSSLSTPNRRPRSTGCTSSFPLLPPPPHIPLTDESGSQQQPTATDQPNICKARPILRSKSDVGYRALNVLSLAPHVASTNQQFYDPEQLENFFGHLGLEPEEYNSIIKYVDPDNDSDTCFQGGSNISSSVGSVSGGSNNNNNYGGNEKSNGGSLHHVESTSIVERNARIIKWLCNCRKANQQQPVTVES